MSLNDYFSYIYRQKRVITYTKFFHSDTEGKFSDPVTKFSLPLYNLDIFSSTGGVKVVYRTCPGKGSLSKGDFLSSTQKVCGDRSLCSRCQQSRASGEKSLTHKEEHCVPCWGDL